MTDIGSKRRRSKMMSRIKSSGTRPELVLRKVVRKISRRSIRCNVRSLPGTPDVVVPSLLLVLFMDGCWWHGCPIHGSVPKTRAKFWSEKFRRNSARDREVRASLESSGWTVWRIWEHDVCDLPRLRRNLSKRFKRILSRR